MSIQRCSTFFWPTGCVASVVQSEREGRARFRYHSIGCICPDNNEISMHGDSVACKSWENIIWDMEQLAQKTSPTHAETATKNIENNMNTYQNSLYVCLGQWISWFPVFLHVHWVESCCHSQDSSLPAPESMSVLWTHLRRSMIWLDAYPRQVLLNTPFTFDCFSC